MSRLAYTPAEDAYLEQHYGALSSREIGENIGRSERSVQHRAQRLGLSRYKAWTGPEERRLADMVAEGYGCEFIAKELGRTKSSVYLKVEKLGLRLLYPVGRNNGRGPSLPNEVIHIVRVLDEAGISINDIATLLRRSFPASGSYLRGVCNGVYRKRLADRPAWR